MCKEKTLKEIENILDKERVNCLIYIIKNCSSYMVTPDENEHWLCGNTILTKWNHNTDILASESFDEHHNLENY
jgi:hypothetical protein